VHTRTTPPEKYIMGIIEGKKTHVLRVTKADFGDQYATAADGICKRLAGGVSKEDAILLRDKAKARMS